VVEMEQKRGIEEHMERLDRDFLLRHQNMQEDQLEFEKKVLANASEREASLRAQHREVVSILKNRVKESQVTSREAPENNVMAAEEEQRSSEASPRLLHTSISMNHIIASLQRNKKVARLFRLFDLLFSFQIQMRLAKEFSEREAALIQESEQLRSELRRREHQMAAAMLEKEEEIRKRHRDAMERERHGHTLVDGSMGDTTEVSELKKKLAETEEAAEKKIIAIQSMMDKAMKQEMTELRIQYELKLQAAEKK